MAVPCLGRPWADAGSNAEGDRQVDGRAAKPDEFAQIAGPHLASQRNLDRRHIWPDGTQIVLSRRLDERTSPRGIGGDCGIAKIRRPAAVSPAIDDSAIMDAVGSHDDRPGHPDFLVERRRHRRAPDVFASRRYRRTLETLFYISG